MAKQREPVDELLDALVWMRRKAKKHQPVDDLIDALMNMRREAKQKAEKHRAGAVAKRRQPGGRAQRKAGVAPKRDAGPPSKGKRTARTAH